MHFFFTLKASSYQQINLILHSRFELKLLSETKKCLASSQVCFLQPEESLAMAIIYIQSMEDKTAIPCSSQINKQIKMDFCINNFDCESVSK